MIIRKKKILALGFIILLGGLLGTVLPATVAVNNENLPVRNLEFINVELRQVFRSLAATGRFNVILDQTVKGNVSIAFKSGITAQEAVAVIAKNYGHQYQWLPDSKTIFIGVTKNLTGNLNGKTLVDIPLKYIDATLAASSLEIVIPKERIKPDSGGRKLIVFGNSLELQNANEIITKIDRSQAEVNVEVKVVEVNDDFWRSLRLDRKVIYSHIGIYPVSASQEKGLNDQNLIQPLARRNLTLFDNQEGKLFFGDKMQKTIEKNNSQADPGSPAIEFMDMGTTMKITSWVGEENKITLQVKETTLTAALTVTSKNEAGFSPGVSSREVTSIISMEAGQTFILTGIIGRDEFNRLKKNPGAHGPRNYPVLNELFAVDNSWPASLKTNTRVIAIITPKYPADDAKQDSLPDNGQPADGVPQLNPDQSPGGSLSDSKTGTQDDGGNGKPADDSNNSVVMIEYLVKKSDTITGISAKFNLELKDIITANQWNSQNVVIKADSLILIPVPKGRIYEIKPKETLWRIAKRYGSTVELLKDLNNITDIEKVKTGQKIVLPVAVTQIKDSRF